MRAHVPTSIPTPATFFKRTPLGDDVVIRWSEMIAYFELLGDIDNRMSVETIGRDSRGQPLLLLIIGSPHPSPARTTLAITAGIHAHELAGSQLMPGLVYDLLTAADDETRNLLDRATLLVAPCLNPTGLEIVADWREETAGTPFSGSHPPGQTHPLGHDLNRDWIVQTQPETRAVVERLFNRWRPNVALDLHEMAPNGPRYALPPYVAPIDPNIPQAISTEAGRIGRAIANAMHHEGKSGITTGLFFDGYSPARAYPPYHGGVRVLAEAAGTRLGRPVYLSTDEMPSAPGYDPNVPSPHQRAAWPGGRWSLADVAEHHRIAIKMTLRSLIETPPWVSGAAEDQPRRPSIGASPPEPQAFMMLPFAMQRDPAAARTLATTLQRGGVRIRRSVKSFDVRGVRFPRETLVIESNQPDWAWAKTLLEVKHYVMSEGRTSRMPYDVTAQTLPLLMGVDVIAVDSVPALDALNVPAFDVPTPRVVGDARVAVYRSRRPDASEAGWALSMLRDAGCEATVLDDSDLHTGDLGKHTVILLPHQEPDHLLHGLNVADYPVAYTGGIGRRGTARLRDWVARGGTLIAVDGACRAIIPHMNLPVEIAAKDYLAPGSILKIEVDLSSDIAEGCERELAVMSLSSAAFNIERPEAGVSAIARYPIDDPLLSGWLGNWRALSGRAAIAECRIGDGRILLFGCRPLFRGQSLAACRLVVNAIRHARMTRAG